MIGTKTNLAVSVSVDEVELDRTIYLLRIATRSESLPLASIKEKLQEADRLDGIFRRIYNSAGIELDMHNVAARRAGDSAIVNHPSQRLLEEVAAMRAFDRE